MFRVHHLIDVPGERRRGLVLVLLSEPESRPEAVGVKFRVVCGHRCAFARVGRRRRARVRASCVALREMARWELLELPSQRGASGRRARWMRRTAPSECLKRNRLHEALE